MNAKTPDASDAIARDWIRSGPKRKSKSQDVAAAIFGMLLAVPTGLAVGFDSEHGLLEGMLVGALAFSLAFIFGAYLALRRKKRNVPDYVRTFAREEGFSLGNRELDAISPILQQPFSRTYGVSSGPLFENDSIKCAIAPYDYVRRNRWHAEMFFRVMFRIYGEPAGRRFVATVVEVPQTRELLPVMLCERRFGAKLLDPVEDVARRLKRLKTESASLGGSHEIFVLPTQEPNWPRRILAPSFITWLAGEGRDVAWELVDGQLCVTTERRADSSEELDRSIAAAAHVVKHLLQEVEQTNLDRPPALF